MIPVNMRVFDGEPPQALEPAIRPYAAAPFCAELLRVGKPCSVRHEKLTRNPKSHISIVRGEHVLAHPRGSSSVGSHYCPIFVGDGQRGRRVVDVPLSWLVFRRRGRVLRTVRPSKNYSGDVS